MKKKTILILMILLVVGCNQFQAPPAFKQEIHAIAAMAQVRHEAGFADPNEWRDNSERLTKIVIIMRDSYDGKESE